MYVNTKCAITVCDTDGTTFRNYQAYAVPHIGEFLYFPHFGTFEVIAVVYNISDDRPNQDMYEELMFVQVIIDLSKKADWKSHVLKGSRRSVR